MKKLFTYSLLALSIFVLPACGDDEDDKKTDPAPVAIDPAASITGNWNLVRAYSVSKDASGNGTPKDETMAPGGYVVNFAASNAYEETLNGTKKAGTYSKANNTLTVSVSPATLLTGTNTIDTLNATRLVFSRSSVSNGVTTSNTFTLKR